MNMNKTMFFALLLAGASGGAMQTQTSGEKQDEEHDTIGSRLEAVEGELVDVKGRRQNNCLVLRTLFLFQVVIAISSGITRAWQAP